MKAKPQGAAGAMSRLSWYERIFLVPLLISALCLLLTPRSAWAASDEKPKWQEYRSAHFVVITDAGDKKGREIVVRFEQMRAVFAQLLARKRIGMPLPLTIYALRNDKQFFQMAPVHSGQPISVPGFFVFGQDRAYIVLNAFEEEPWRAVAHDFAHYLMNYNYPPVQPWFDEGFAEYFSSIRPDDKHYELGSDPELTLGYEEDVLGDQTQVRNRPRSLTELLNQPVWMTVPDLFTARHEITLGAEGTHRTLFYAQSWITVSYLMNKSKLSELGTYFDLVENQKSPVDQALQQAFGLSAAQFGQAIKDYYHSLGQLQGDLEAAQQPGALNRRAEIYQFPALLGPDEVDISAKPVSEIDARARLAEVMVRLPERRQQGLNELQAVLAMKDKNGQPIDNEIAHRALAWVAIERKDFQEAAEQLAAAAALNPSDNWLRYYLSLAKYRQAQANHQEIQGLANMMTDLKVTLDWYPEFAEAYNMLAMARLEGGGTNSALDAIRAAIALSPRNQQYIFNLAQVYVAQKKWDSAQAIFERLTSSLNPLIAAAARAQLQDLATEKKYGISPNSPKRVFQSSPFDELTQEAQRRSQTQTQVQQDIALDKRPTQYLRGRLLSVDCSQAPAAVLRVETGSKTLQLRTADYKSLLVIGADSFSCEWRDQKVSVNYKARGASDGDLVSLELRGN
jgi:tetratricopeptide (TPR) repeat protein